MSERKSYVSSRLFHAGGLILMLVSLSVVMTASAAVAVESGATKEPKTKTAAKPKPKRVQPLSATGILRYGDSYPTASGYDRFSHLVVTRPFARAAARLPGKSLIYMNGTTVYATWSTGVSHDEARTNNWLLRDANGALLTNAAFGGNVADIGSPAYRQRFVANVSEFLRRHGNDGVFIDDVRASGTGFNGSSPAQYPTQAAWEEAMVGFVVDVGSALRARGYYVLVNASAWLSNDHDTVSGESYARFYKRIARHVDGIMIEYWMQTPPDVARLRSQGDNWWEHWDGWQSLAAITQSAGADFFALTYGSAGDTRAMRYGRASFLLDWNGKGGAFFWDMTDKRDPYHPTAVKQLGPPVGEKFERQPSVWQRRYERGIVLVNSSTSTVRVRVGAHTLAIAATDAVFARVPARP